MKAKTRKLTLLLLALCMELPAALAWGQAAGPAAAGIDPTLARPREMDIFTGLDPSRVLRSRVRSWQDMKDEHVVMQRFDYSCGAAALATLLRYYFQDNVTETQLLDAILGPMKPDEVKDRQKNGLSMDDLFRVCKQMHYLVTVYRLPLKNVPELQAPVLVRLVKNKFKHFVILRGSVEDQIFLADPERGNIRISVYEFIHEWSGEALIVGKRGFGQPKDYPLAVDKNRTRVRNELDPLSQWITRHP